MNSEIIQNVPYDNSDINSEIIQNVAYDNYDDFNIPTS
jgi:hypothetical protein